MGSNPIPRTTDQSHASEDRVNFALWLKKKVVRGRRLCDATIAGKVRILKQLARRVNLWDADAFSEFVNNADWTKLRKNLMLYAYRGWCNFKGFSFKFQKYPEERNCLTYLAEQCARYMTNVARAIFARSRLVYLRSTFWPVAT